MGARHELRVFVDEQGRFGNRLVVLLDSATMDDVECRAIAQEAGTSETVFVDDAAAGRVRIFTPNGRIPFAGYPLIGVGWLLRRLGAPVARLVTDAGPVPVAGDGLECAIDTMSGRGNPWTLIERAVPADVLLADPAGPDRHDYVWAWEDPEHGNVRARAFTSASGTIEDEATGSAAIELCASLRRPLVIRQGAGSLIHVRPIATGYRLSGRVARA